jgi:hypothetical protein
MKNSPPNQSWSISYKQLAILAFTFVLGALLPYFISNQNAETLTTFTTIELIGLVLSVILSGASIFLAIAAISLGKISEQAMIQRSDESIRLQNEVFTKTMDALQRIESSTGVTEKRMEDMIGLVSHKAAVEATRGNKGFSMDTQALEDKIKQSLKSELSSNTSRTGLWQDNLYSFNEKMFKEEAESEKAYHEAHDGLIFGIANLKGNKIEKMQHGSISKDGDDLFDSIFKSGKNRFAVSTFRYGTSEDVIFQYITKAAVEVSSKSITSVHLYVFVEEPLPELESEINAHLENLKDSISKSFKISYLNYKDAKKKASEFSLSP